MLKSPAETYTFILIFEMPKEEREKKDSLWHKNEIALILLIFNRMDDFYMLFNHHRTEPNCTALKSYWHVQSCFLCVFVILMIACNSENSAHK